MANRSNVICNNDCPVPSTSKNCLGLICLLKGQNLVPEPPAIITAYMFFIDLLVKKDQGCIKMKQKRMSEMIIEILNAIVFKIHYLHEV